MNEGISVLVVDDEKSMCTYLETFLSLKGYRVKSVMSGQEALDCLKRDTAYSVIILDIMMPEMDGFETLQKIRQQKKNIPIIMLSALGQAKMVVKAIKLGASDYVTKDFEADELEISINNVLEKRRLVEEVKDLREQLKKERRSEFISVSKEMEDIKRIIEQTADTNVTVLIQGESGVGKEIIARYVYSKSSRRDKPFIKVSCASLPGTLLESELFGYEKGAFTGAYINKPGRFGFANQGTIFLDEIGEMPISLQAKLLQVLQDGVFTRLGAKEETLVDARVIAATNVNIEKAIKGGTFREDLYHRLNVVNIRIPPLRERKEDIPILCEHFLDKYNLQYNRELRTFSKKLMGLFMDHQWHGNVRELENMIKRVIVLRDEEPIIAELEGTNKKFEKKLSDSSGPVSLKNLTKKKTLEVEREEILKALDQTNWNRKKAAEQLGINYKTLLYKLKKL